MVDVNEVSKQINEETKKQGELLEEAAKNADSTVDITKESGGNLKEAAKFKFSTGVVLKGMAAGAVIGLGLGVIAGLGTGAALLGAAGLIGGGAIGRKVKKKATD